MQLEVVVVVEVVVEARVEEVLTLLSQWLAVHVELTDSPPHLAAGSSASHEVLQSCPAPAGQMQSSHPVLEQLGRLLRSFVVTAAESFPA
jgi:hypothetical protein